MLAVDLFAGTGSATLGFREAGWTVIEVDLVRPPADGRGPAAVVTEPGAAATRPDGHPTSDGHRSGGLVLADCRALPLGAELNGRVDFLWASPPCTEFSDANSRVDHTRKRPSLELVTATLEAVALLRPRFWILENVRGAIPFLGIPVQKIGPFCLWGYFPAIAATWEAGTYRKATAGRSAIARAVIPPALARAVYQAVDRGQRSPSILDLRPFRRHRAAAARETATRRRTATRELFEATAQRGPAALDLPEGT